MRRAKREPGRGVPGRDGPAGPADGGADDPCPVTLRGIVPSLHTPFTDDNTIDEDALGRLVDRTVDSGCSGMLVGAVAGEADHLTMEERRRIAGFVLDRAGGAVPVVVAVSAGDQATRVALARMAREEGAGWMLCQAPETGTDDVFSELADVGPPNLMIQDLSWDGSGMSLECVLRLFDTIAAFRSLKIETVPAGPKYTEVLRATGGRLHVSGGWAIIQMIDALNRGVHALMPSAMDPIYVRIHRLYRSGEEEAARRLFEMILPVLAFTQQRLETSIDLFKRLRVAEGIFVSARRRAATFPPDAFQEAEMERLVARIMALQDEIGPIERAVTPRPTGGR